MTVSRFLLFWVVLATVVWVSLMQNQFRAYQTPQWPIDNQCGRLPASNTALIELELANSSARFTCLIGPSSPFGATGIREHNLDVLQRNTHMDYLFIALYWSSFLLFAWQGRGWLAALLAVAITAAASFDLAENSRLLGGVKAMRKGLSEFPVPGFPSGIKWLLLSFAMLLLATLLARVPEFWHRLFTLLVALAGLGTLIGVFKHDLLGLALLILFSAMVLSLFLYWPWANTAKSAAKQHEA
jgi:hypothetical protein